MTQAELIRDVLQGVLVIVGEYRGSHAEEAGYVDRKFGTAIKYVRAIHLAECSWVGHIDRVIITERFPDRTIEEAQATFRYTRGKRYAFYIEWFKRERGQTFAGLSPWGIEEIEDIAEDGCRAVGAAPSPNLVLLGTTPQHL
jgi:hypothetical protein